MKTVLPHDQIARDRCHFFTCAVRILTDNLFLCGGSNGRLRGGSTGALRSVAKAYGLRILKIVQKFPSGMQLVLDIKREQRAGRTKTCHEIIHTNIRALMYKVIHKRCYKVCKACLRKFEVQCFPYWSN